MGRQHEPGCHHGGTHSEEVLSPGAQRIVLAGNPNCGKSVLFHRLTGVYVEVSNYPGTTVEVFNGRLGRDLVIDTPGIYGVSSFNDEERVTRDIVLQADLVINVVDAVHLERDLFLTLQLIDMGLPMVVALNMMDEAEKRNLALDVPGLENLLGVPVVPTVAVTGRGIDRLRGSLLRARVGRPDTVVVAHLESLADKVKNRPEALLILEGDPMAAGRHGLAPMNGREELYRRRRQRADAIVDEVVSQRLRRTGPAWDLGGVMVRPLTGIPILLFILFGIYQLVGVFIAQTVVSVTEETVMQGWYEPLVRGLLTPWVSRVPPLATILIGEFGVLTMTVTYILGLLLPLVAGFYLVLGIMEDSGYLPRLATLADRTLTGIGLNGRAVIPFILGLGCVTMATITTRILGTRRERTIATFLLALAVPCSAQLAVITAMAAPLGPLYLVAYVLAILTVFAVVGTLLSKILPGTSTDLFIDLPPLRFPRPRNVLEKTWTRAWMFVREAGPLFFYGALVIGILQVTGVLDWLQGLLAPLTTGWLGLPREASTAFVMGIVRRDFGAAGLYALNLTPFQSLVSLVTITLFVPCIASMLVIVKERGRRDGLLIWLATFLIAFLVGGLVARIAAGMPR